LNDLYAELEKSSTYLHTWLGLNPQIGRPLSRIVGTIGLFFMRLKYNNTAGNCVLYYFNSEFTNKTNKNANIFVKLLVLFVILLITSCTLRALLRLHFNLHKTRYFVLIVFIEELLNMKYFLSFLPVCTRINRKVFQRVSKLHTVVHVRSMDFSNLVHTLITMSLSFFDGHCKSKSYRILQTFELERHICQNHWNAWQ
jgi:hypothetical protein